MVAKVYPRDSDDKLDRLIELPLADEGVTLCCLTVTDLKGASRSSPKVSRIKLHRRY